MLPQNSKDFDMLVEKFAGILAVQLRDNFSISELQSMFIICRTTFENEEEDMHVHFVAEYFKMLLEGLVEGTEERIKRES